MTKKQKSNWDYWICVLMGLLFGMAWVENQSWQKEKEQVAKTQQANVKYKEKQLPFGVTWVEKREVDKTEEAKVKHRERQLKDLESFSKGVKRLEEEKRKRTLTKT